MEKIIIEEILSKEFFIKFPKPHYLLEKPVKDWDEYDWNNFKSIVRKILGIL